MELTFAFPLDRWFSQQVLHKAKGELYDYVGFRTFPLSEQTQAEQTVEFLQSFGVSSAFLYRSRHNSRIAVVADLDELETFKLMHMPDMALSSPEHSRETAESKVSRQAQADEIERIGKLITSLRHPGATMSMS
ncbi:MAG: hypothetical protein IT567_07215 [Alphaproteobacteria bacterium]|nr:hypothetical protein [Alphaproteobacteria bacterium]